MRQDGFALLVLKELLSGVLSVSNWMNSLRVSFAACTPRLKMRLRIAASRFRFGAAPRAAHSGDVGAAGAPFLIRCRLATRRRYDPQTLVLVVSLLAIGFLAGHQMSAQVSQDPSLRADVFTLTQPFVLAGPDVGFRVVRMDGSIPVGQVVVKINGAWVAAEASK